MVHSEKSISGKSWQLKPPAVSHTQAILSEELKVDRIVAGLLAQRGIETFEEAKAFFRPDTGQLHDPFLMKDLNKAAKRLSAALKSGEKIMVYGDYDVDGTTSVTLVTAFLLGLNATVDYYIPDRYAEGYGLSMKGIDYCIETGCTLMICLDCGIKAHHSLIYAVSKGLDIIVCDHHNPDETLPPAFALLDPKRKDCLYPYKELSGCGVGFKLLQGLCRLSNLDEKKLYACLDLVCISIAADIVPITGENRTLAALGLKQINSESRRPGLKALADVAGYPKSMQISSLVFGIAPRINAAGRMAHGKFAVDLLLEKDVSKALEMSRLLNITNDDRREADQGITAEALSMIEESAFERNAYSTVLYKKDWHKGVVGIVASRCIEKYYRPTIILSQAGDRLTGSARSVPGFDIYEALSECSSYLEQFGGHAYAAGLSLPASSFEAFRNQFEQVVASRITENMRHPTLWLDMEVSLTEMTQKLFRLQEQMAPFGPGNMQPVFLARNVLVSDVRLLKEAHLKFKIPLANNATLDAIFFSSQEFHDLFRSGRSLDLCFNLTMNYFQDTSSLQLNIRDARASASVS